MAAFEFQNCTLRDTRRVLGRQLVIKDLLLKAQAGFVNPTEEMACIGCPRGEKPVDRLLD